MSRERKGGRREAKAKLAKAQEFLAGAQDALAQGRSNVACSDAVTAAINANDALCLAFLQRYSTSQSHTEALRMAQQCGPTGRKVATLLERVLKAKDTAQYETTSIGHSEAATVIDRATRLVDLVQPVVLEER